MPKPIPSPASPKARRSYRDELKKAKARATGNHANFMKEKAKMNFENYREAARRTRNGDLTEEQAKRNALFGIPDEAGEIIGLAKKVEFHEHPYSQEKIKDEMGDLLYYFDWYADLHGLTLAEIAEYNVAKLKKRYPNGFSAEASRNRDD